MIYPFEQQHRHFWSGVNHAGEVHGLMGEWIGIAATHCSAALLEALDTYAGAKHVFVDSGAFSEVEFGANGPRVVKPITHAEWLRRFDVYREIAAAHRTRAYLVTPDQVGNQAVTLERLTRYGHIMRALVLWHRCRVIVPVQKGADSMADFFTRSLLALRLPRYDDVGEPIWPIAGIPMKKDATSIEELAEFAEAMPNGAHFHLLGLGPESKRYGQAIAAIKRVNPDAVITSDSNTIRRLVGRTNGRGGGPRALTRATDAARSRGLSGSNLKAAALGEVTLALHRAELQRAYESGWSDPELEGERPGYEAPQQMSMGELS